MTGSGSGKHINFCDEDPINFRDPAHGYGEVFEIVKTNGVYASTPTVLVSFNALTSGAYPQSSLIADAAGDLFGTTYGGGANSDGVVFEIAKTNGVYASTPTVLVSFNGANGENPQAGLIADAAGDLFGTTTFGGANRDGAVFEIAKTNGVYASTLTVLASFNGDDGTAADGAVPDGGLIADAAGDLFGTTAEGGANDDGVVFEIAKTNGVYASTPTVLLNFSGADGLDPASGLIADAAGDLFGTTQGGDANSDGGVFEVVKSNGVYASTPTVLVSFDGANGANPEAGLIADAAGDLFGTTLLGGANGDGELFEIAKNNGVYASTPTVLVSFSGANGANPEAGLIADAAGDLFGTTSGGGANDDGTVFALLAAPLDPGPTLTSTPPAKIGHGQSATIGTVTPGLPGDTETLTIVSAPSEGNLSLTNGVVTYTETVPGGLPDNFSYKITDQYNDVSATATDSIAIDPGPTLFSSPPAKIGHGQSAAIGSFVLGLANDSENLSIVNAPAYGTLSVVNNTVVYTETAPVPTGGLTDSFSYEITDQLGDVSTTASDSIALDPGPTLTSTPPTNIANGQSATIGTVAVGLAGDTETLTIVRGPATGNVSLVNGVVTYTETAAVPTGGLTDNFSYKITDQLGDVSTTASDRILLYLPLPAISGAAANQNTYDLASIAPFSGLSITDPNSNQTETVTVTPSSTANGTLSDPNAATDGSLITNGVYTVSGTAAQVQADVRALVFTPIVGQVTYGNTVTTSFTVATKDTAGQTASDSTTSVIATATAPTTDVVTFSGSNGANPVDNLITDAAGDLFGTTEFGGANGEGTVFEIAKTPAGYANTPTILFSFHVSYGAGPSAGLVTDAAGDLFGTTEGGGTYNDGIAFEIAKTASGYASTATVLVSFNNSNGDDPEAGLIADAAGDLFGTTADGGANDNGDNGVVFEVAKTNGVYAGTPTVVVNFNGTNGQNPAAGLIADAAGDLFGTTYGGGANSDGEVFEIAKTNGAYASTPTLLASFNGANGADPQASLIVDAAGDLFGTTETGGANRDGAVFEIAKTNGAYASTPTLLASFNGANGTYPQASLIADAAGDLFGTTKGGGTYHEGTAFEIAKTANGYASQPTILVSFNGSNGAFPEAGLTADTAGDLFGTTYQGGSGKAGTVFEITNTGFIVAKPTLTSTPPAEIGHGQSATIGTVVAGVLGDIETLSLVTAPSYGTLALANGVVTYTETAGVPTGGLTDNFSYKITDQRGAVSTTSSDSITLDPGPGLTSSAPVKLGHGQSAVIGTVTPGLVGDTETLTLVTAPSYGTLSLNNGTVTYLATNSVPVGGEIDGFSYKITDQLGDVSTVASASIDLDPGPTLTSSVPSFVGRGQTVRIGTVAPGLIGDSETLTVVHAPTFGTLALSHGTVTYTAPSAVPVGGLTDDLFNYAIFDQLGDRSIGVEAIIQVDPGPTLTSTPPAKLGHGQVASIGTVTAGFIVDTETLTILTAPKYGTLALSSGTITYAETVTVPTGGEFDSFSYEITDQLGDVSTIASPSIDLDPGPTLTSTPPAKLGHGQTTTIGTVTAGLIGDTETLTILTAPKYGTLSLSNGTITYAEAATVPIGGEFDSFSYKITDQLGDVSIIASPSIDLDPGPALTSTPPAKLGHGQTATIGTVAAGLIVDTETLTILTAPKYGTLALSSGTITYAETVTVPTGGEFDSFSYEITDQLGDVSTIASPSIDLDPGPTLTSTPPAKLGHGQTTTIGTVTAGLIGDTETLTILTAPKYGTLSLSNGTITYAEAATVPIGGEFDSFSYKITDQLGDVSIIASPSIDLDPGPALTSTPPAKLGHGQTATIGTVAVGLIGDTETLTILTAPKYGTLALSSGTITYAETVTVPTGGEFDSFSYEITDQLGDVSTIASPSIDLDPGPTLTSTPPAKLGHGQTATIGTVAAGLIGDTETLTTLTAPKYGTLALSNGTITYAATNTVPTGGEFDSFSYEITDQLGDVSITASPSIDLDPGPALTSTPPAKLGHGQTAVIGTVAVGLIGDTETLTILTAPKYGTLALSSGTITYAETVTVPTGGEFDSFSYEITDQLGDVSTIASPSIDLDPGPTLTSTPPAKLGHGQTTTIGTVTAGLIGDTETLTILTAPKYGTLALSNGTITYAATNTVPTGGEFDSFSYEITDQLGDVSITASPSIDLDPGPALTSTPPAKLGHGQTAVIGTVTAGLIGDTETLTILTAPLYGTLALSNGTITYAETATVPTGGEFDRFSYKITDQLGDVSITASSSIDLDPGPTLTSTPPAKLGHGQTATIGTVTAGLIGDTETLTILTAPKYGTLALSNGTVTYTETAIVPTGGEFDSFSYKITDQLGDVSIIASPSIDLDPGPALTSTPPVKLGHGQNAIIGTVAVGLIGDTETLTTLTAPKYGTLALSNGTITYTATNTVPTGGEFDSFSYEITDQIGDVSIVASPSIDLDPGPTLSSTPPAKIGHGQTAIIGTVAAGLIGDSETLTTLTAPKYGTLALSNGTITYAATNTVPTGGEFDSFSYKVTDQLGDVSITASPSIDLDPGPALTSTPPAKIGHGQSAAIGSVAVGLAGDTETLTLVSAPADGTLSLLNGVVTYTETKPVPTGGLTDTFSYKITDQLGDVSTTASDSIALDPGPMAATAKISVNFGSTTDLTAQILAAVTPGLVGDSETITAIGSTSPNGGETLSAGAVGFTATGGSLQHIPANGSTTVSFSYTVTDQLGETATATVQVTVSNPADNIYGSLYGNSVIQGTAGADVITAYGVNNVIYDNGGNDLVYAGAGLATVYTSSGDVIVNLSGQNNNVSGGDGWDTVSGSQGGTTITLGNGNDAITLGGNNNSVTLGNGTDSVTGSTGNTTIKTGDGADMISAGGGGNTITVGNGNDNINGGSGNELITAGNGNDTVAVTGGNNRVTLGNGNDTLTLGGGSGNTVTLGTGNDSVSGSVGNTIITASSGSGADMISALGGNNQITLADGANTVTLDGSGETVIAGNGGNTVTGSTGNSTIRLGNGADIVSAGGANNSVVTGAGADTITLSGFGNALDAGGGRNMVFLGGPQDTLALHAAGDDVISGFSLTGNDALNFAAVLSEAHLILANPSALGAYVHVVNTGGTASLLFDPTGQFAGGQTEIASLQNIGGNVNSLNVLINAGVIRVS